MAVIVVTGAAGGIGRRLVAAFGEDGHEVRGLDVAPGGDPRVEAADLLDWEGAWRGRLPGADAVVHLAATADPAASWEEAARLNVDLLLNILEAATIAGVPRVVFASSNWVLAGHRFGEGPLGSGTPPAPVNAYGATKLFGERAAHHFARARGLSVVCLRIGAAPEDPAALPAADGPGAEWTARMWISERDLVEGFRRAVAAPADLRFAVLNLMSANPGTRWDLGETEARIGWRPRDAFEAPEGAAEREAQARPLWRARDDLDRFLREAQP